MRTMQRDLSSLVLHRNDDSHGIGDAIALGETVKHTENAVSTYLYTTCDGLIECLTMRIVVRLKMTDVRCRNLSSESTTRMHPT